MKKYNFSLFIFLVLMYFSNCVFAQSGKTITVDDVVITNNLADVSGLTKVGNADITKTAFLGKQEGLTKKAAEELKQQALANGATIIYININQYIPDPRNYFNKVHMAGAFYKKNANVPGQPVVPHGDTSNTTIKNLDNNIDLTITGCTGDAEKQTVTIFFTFSNPRKAHQRIALFNDMLKHSSAFDTDGNQFTCKFFTLGNQTSYDVSTELPTGLRANGSATFANVLTTSTKLALVNIYCESRNWDGGGDGKGGTIEIKNVVINWNNKPPAVPSAVTQNAVKANTADYLTYNDLITKLNNGESAANKKVILDDIYFETNKDVITDDSKTTLQNVLKLLIKYPKLKITILGHTDNVGRDDDNLSLSISRAHSVVNYLVSKGIDRDRMFYKGFGSTVPIGDNGTEDGKAKNRRTEMLIMEQ